jgi:hypothetical protein
MIPLRIFGGEVTLTEIGHLGPELGAPTTTLCPHDMLQMLKRGRPDSRDGRQLSVSPERPL